MAWWNARYALSAGMPVRRSTRRNSRRTPGCGPGRPPARSRAPTCWRQRARATQRSDSTDRAASHCRRSIKSAVLGKGFGRPLPPLIDDEIAGDLEQPGAEVAAPVSRRHGPPHLRPHLLMDILEWSPGRPARQGTRSAAGRAGRTGCGRRPRPVAGRAGIRPGGRTRRPVRRLGFRPRSRSFLGT